MLLTLNLPHQVQSPLRPKPRWQPHRQDPFLLIGKSMPSPFPQLTLPTVLTTVV